MRALRCDAQLNLTQFAAQRPHWSAAELITAVEAIRKPLRVPFYLYEAPVIPLHIDVALRAIELSPCRATMWDGEYCISAGTRSSDPMVATAASEMTARGASL